MSTRSITDRTERLQAEIDERLPALEAQLEAQPEGADTSLIDAQIAQYETLRAGPDPTINVQTRAALPSGAATPKPTLTIIGALFGGLVLGIVAAFASQVLDPRLRDEAQLRRLYRLPVLGSDPQAAALALAQATRSARGRAADIGRPTGPCGRPSPAACGPLHPATDG